MGPAGSLVVGFLGLVLLVSLVTGAIIYGPMMKRFAFGVLRRERKARTLLADVHKLLGAASFGWMLVVVVTGILLSLGSTLLQYYTMTELAALSAPYANDPPVADVSSIDQALAEAEAASHGRRWSLVALPGSDFASPRHYAVLLNGHEGLDKRMLTMGLIASRRVACNISFDVGRLISMKCSARRAFVPRPRAGGAHPGPEGLRLTRWHTFWRP